MFVSLMSVTGAVIVFSVLEKSIRLHEENVRLIVAKMNKMCLISLNFGLGATKLYKHLPLVYSLYMNIFSTQIDVMGLVAPVLICCIPLAAIFVCMKLFVSGFRTWHGILACLLGLLSVVPITALQFVIDLFGGGGILSGKTLPSVLLHDLIINGLIEETIKMLLLFLLPWKKMRLAEFFSCAVLSGFTLGCFETIVYSLAGTGTAPLRMVTSVIVHGSCAALSGLFVFSCRHKSPRAFSYIFAVILHGVYNYFAGFDMSSPFFYMSFAVIAIAVIECRTRYINERKNLLPQEESAPAAVGFGHKAAVEKNSADKTLIEAKIRDSQDKTLVGVKFSGSADVAQEKRAADVIEEIPVEEDALPAQTGALVSKTEAPVKKATAVSETKTAVRKTRASGGSSKATAVSETKTAVKKTRASGGSAKATAVSETKTAIRKTRASGGSAKATAVNETKTTVRKTRASGGSSKATAVSETKTAVRKTRASSGSAKATAVSEKKPAAKKTRAAAAGKTKTKSEK